MQSKDSYGISQFLSISFCQISVCEWLAETARICRYIIQKYLVLPVYGKYINKSRTYRNKIFNFPLEIEQTRDILSIVYYWNIEIGFRCKKSRDHITYCQLAPIERHSFRCTKHSNEPLKSKIVFSKGFHDFGVSFPSCKSHSCHFFLSKLTIYILQ